LNDTATMSGGVLVVRKPDTITGPPGSTAARIVPDPPARFASSNTGMPIDREPVAATGEGSRNRTKPFGWNTHTIPRRPTSTVLRNGRCDEGITVNITVPANA